MFAGVRVGITDEGGGAVVGIPIGTDAFVQAHAANMVKKKGAECLARHLVHIPDKHAVMLVATKSIARKTCYLDWSGGRTSTSLKERFPCRPRGAMDAEAHPRALGGGRRRAFLADGCPPRTTASTCSRISRCKRACPPGQGIRACFGHHSAAASVDRQPRRHTTENTCGLVWTTRRQRAGQIPGHANDRCTEGGIAKPG